MATTRATKSRATEFNVILGSVSSPRQLTSYIKQSPAGGTVTIDGVAVEYGNVRSLVSHLNAKTAIFPLPKPASFAGHIDSIKADRKRVLERLYGLPGGSLTDSKSRTDVLIIATDGRPYFLSVKDPSTSAKLGQVSTRTKYGGASLTGGLSGLSVPIVHIPTNVDVSQTHLTSAQFEKLSPQDRRYAFLKANYSTAWKEAVQNQTDKAIIAARRFGDALASDRRNFLAFFGEVLAGNLVNSRDFYLLLGNRLIRFADLHKKLQKSKFEVSWEEYRPRKKSSIIIWLQINGVKYCITKVEPSFDGGSPKASQTKGIIYYFQQHLRTGNTYKQLLADLS